MRAELTDSRGRAIHLRAATPADEAFLAQLYADRRAAELAPLGWSDNERAAFLAMQFRAQQDGYGAAFPDADHWILMDGAEPVGRLLVARRAHEHRVVDLVIQSGWRGRGIGTGLMEQVIADATAAGVPVGLTVDAQDGRVVGWYERLGFSIVDRHPMYLGMTRRVS